jgi:hypothetical protein
VYAAWPSGARIDEKSSISNCKCDVGACLDSSHCWAEWAIVCHLWGRAGRVLVHRDDGFCGRAVMLEIDREFGLRKGCCKSRDEGDRGQSHQVGFVPQMGDFSAPMIPSHFD